MTWMAAEREANDARKQERRANADPACSICKGFGETTGYIAPSKLAVYACPCTGMADWQRCGTTSAGNRPSPESDSPRSGSQQGNK